MTKKPGSGVSRQRPHSGTLAKERRDSGRQEDKEISSSETS